MGGCVGVYNTVPLAMSNISTKKNLTIIETTGEILCFHTILFAGTSLGIGVGLIYGALSPITIPYSAYYLHKNNYKNPFTGVVGESETVTESTNR
jgi:hypothetical protein